MPDKPFDILIIGGGINGAGIARDAAGRGLRVALCEKDDLGAGTSSRSGKLIHGGLRYLEYYAFSLVRKALIEREVLLALAPHIVWPMRFVLPHSTIARPAWLVRLGLFLYDHLGGRKRLPGTRKINLHKELEGKPLKQGYKIAFEYSDCWVDDARLVVLNALDAYEKGAMIYPRTTCISAKREKDLWHVTLHDNQTSKTWIVRARALINAAGPWVNDILSGVVRMNTSRQIRLVKGSHFIVPKFWDGDHAYLIQNTDKRVIFVNPYLESLALIGTTDVPYEQTPEDAAMDADETAYLLDVLGQYFRNAPKAEDIISSYAGVRPLYDDHTQNPSAVTRDYMFDLDAPTNQPPLLSIFGGKITTFRKLALDVMDRLAPFFDDMGPAWTDRKPLPGGDMADGDFDRFISHAKRTYPFLPTALSKHYARLYGTRMTELLGKAKKIEDLGRHFGGMFYEAEARYLTQTEWAMTSEDILQRRTKHGLFLSDEECAAFISWFAGTLNKTA
ncbi:MAG: glycerol-3-phosphate dehydrogenase [Pseudomonadota bacterium]